MKVLMKKGAYTYTTHHSPAIIHALLIFKIYIPLLKLPKVSPS